MTIVAGVKPTIGDPVTTLTSSELGLLAKDLRGDGRPWAEWRPGAASDAVILGFNVRPEGNARELAEREHVDVRYYSVIYAAIEDVENALKGMLKPEFEEQTLGQAEVRAIFRSSRIGKLPRRVGLFRCSGGNAS